MNRTPIIADVLGVGGVYASFLAARATLPAYVSWCTSSPDARF